MTLAFSRALARLVQCSLQGARSATTRLGSALWATSLLMVSGFLASRSGRRQERSASRTAMSNVSPMNALHGADLVRCPPKAR